MGLNDDHRAFAAYIAAELGFTQETLQRLQRLPFEQGQTALAELQVLAKRAYKKLAFQWHPDRNPGDAESELKFKMLGPVLEHILTLRAKPRRPRPIRQQRTVWVNPRATTAGTQTINFTMQDGYFQRARQDQQKDKKAYDVRRVIFIHVT